MPAVEQRKHKGLNNRAENRGSSRVDRCRTDVTRHAVIRMAALGSADRLSDDISAQRLLQRRIPLSTTRAIVAI
jgi:hypothetical protein